MRRMYVRYMVLIFLLVSMFSNLYSQTGFIADGLFKSTIDSPINIIGILGKRTWENSLNLGVVYHSYLLKTTYGCNIKGEFAGKWFNVYTLNKNSGTKKEGGHRSTRILYRSEYDDGQMNW